MPNYSESSKPEFNKVIERLDNELKNIRTGRANAALVEDVRVEAYGSTMELKGVAAISVPDARTIQIEPWDKGLVKEVEKALLGANLGVTPNVAGTVIRLNMPQMTEETRRDTVKAVQQKGEQSRIAVRNVREDVRQSITKDEEAKVINEDEKFRQFESLDKLVKEYNDKIEKMIDDKEQEVMTI
ncbi:MAG: ribosome recycling factor [Patescibacteria group bacterium]|nr:ribosome recycling factor [Patescibacteria group bacterium]